MPLIKRLKRSKLRLKKTLLVPVYKNLFIKKNSIFKKYINKKDLHIKEELHQKYKYI